MEAELVKDFDEKVQKGHKQKNHRIHKSLNLLVTPGSYGEELVRASVCVECALSINLTWA